MIYVGVRLAKRWKARQTRARSDATPSPAPPPSYTKLFYDEQPPAYQDTIVIKENQNDGEKQEGRENLDEEDTCSDSCMVDMEIPETGDSHERNLQGEDETQSASGSDESVDSNA